MAFTPEQIAAERRLRVRLTIAAYDYELMNGQIGLMADNEFDYLCRQVNLDCPTGNNKLDIWWKENFDPSTGQWIRRHPEQDKAARVWLSLRKGMSP